MLLWRKNPVVLLNNKSIAEKWLLSLKQRYKTEPDSLQKHQDLIYSMLANQQASIIVDNFNVKDSKTWYFPHYPIHNIASGNFLAVFDAWSL